MVPIGGGVVVAIFPVGLLEEGIDSCDLCQSTVIPPPTRTAPTKPDRPVITARREIPRRADCVWLRRLEGTADRDAESVEEARTIGWNDEPNEG